MNIAVCVKQIPDPAEPGALNPDHTLKRDGKLILDESDSYGVEMALQLVDAAGGPYDLPGTTYASMVTAAGLAEIATYADGVGANTAPSSRRAGWRSWPGAQPSARRSPRSRRRSPATRAARGRPPGLRWGRSPPARCDRRDAHNRFRRRICIAMGPAQLESVEAAAA